MSRGQRPLPGATCAARFDCVVPACGISPIFIAMGRVRRLCEIGSRPLMAVLAADTPTSASRLLPDSAIWAINYGVGSVIGPGDLRLAGMEFDLPIWELLAAVLVPVFLFSLLFARHSKALFRSRSLF